MASVTKDQGTAKRGDRVEFGAVEPGRDCVVDSKLGGACKGGGAEEAGTGGEGGGGKGGEGIQKLMGACCGLGDRDPKVVVSLQDRGLFEGSEPGCDTPNLALTRQSARVPLCE